MLKVHMFVIVCLLGCLFVDSSVVAVDVRDQAVLGPDYPRAFFFRGSEAGAARKGAVYEQWRDEFSRLSGIMGKALDEEIPSRSKNIDFFTRFKKDNPDQVVLLHLNGNARDPRWESDRFFAGHWIYYNGTIITADVAAEDGETVIPVSDPKLFKMKTGRYRDKNEDIGLCILGADGKPDWTRSEQVQLLSIDPRGKTIKVKRGCYGTRPMAFPAGKSYAAAHATEGPWGKQSNLLWFYNYATCCPKDGAGRACSEVWAEHIGELFNKNGSLSVFDGLEFDVLYNQTGRYEEGQLRGIDCDADGKPDGGIINGVNLYGSGVIEFCRLLRSFLGENRIIQADAATHNNSSQRAFGLLNGMESEGFPWLGDKEIQNWSSGLNRHMFWAQNGRDPVFNYINHKFVEPTGIPGEPDHHPDVPIGRHRLVFAAGVFTDSAICYAYLPPGPKRGPVGVWDELVGGRDGHVGWLGKPVGPAVHLAEKQPDLLGGIGRPAGEGLLQRLSSHDARLDVDNGSVRMSARDSSSSHFKVCLKDVPCCGSNLFVSVRARAEISSRYPQEMARLIYVGVVDPCARMEKKPSRRTADLPDGFVTYVNQKPFNAGFQIAGVVSTNVDIEITCEMAESVWMEEISVHACPDAMVREFEHGIVLANPSLQPYEFDLAALAPGRSFRRITGSQDQDPKMNDGARVGASVVLPAKDAVFLRKE